MPVASVIVPAFNAASTLPATLEALGAQVLTDPFEVIVVDDGSSDGTVEVARAASLPVTLLEQPNLGPAAARNRGAAAASGRVLAFTDADCVPEPDWLAAGLAALERADLVQGAVRPDPTVARLPFDRTVWVSRESGLYECASLFVRREAFDRVGGFEDWLGARMGKELAEDAWFGWRVRSTGSTTAFESGAVVNHAVFRRGLTDYVAERARLLYFPAIVRRMPGLRRTLLFGRVFISPRAAAFDAVTVSALLTVTLTPLAALGAVPYAVIALRDAAPWRLRALPAFAGEVAADAVGLGALLVGAVRARSLIL